MSNHKVDVVVYLLTLVTMPCYASNPLALPCVSSALLYFKYTTAVVEQQLRKYNTCYVMLLSCFSEVQKLIQHAAVNGVEEAQDALLNECADGCE